MSDHTALTEVAREYAAAHAAHYSERDLPKALRLYKKIMISHASAIEAGYARTQIQNIVNAAVPEQELLNAQLELALARLGKRCSSDAEPVPVMRRGPEEAE